MKEWAKTRSVTLRFNAEEKFKFNKTTIREVESDTKNVTKAGVFGKFESSTVTKVTEHFWQYTIKWELVAFMGNEASKGIVIQSRTGTVELKTSVEKSPKPETYIHPAQDINITWLLQNVDENRTPSFSIDRKAKECRTPRRNPRVDKALVFFGQYFHWSQAVFSYFVNTVFPTQQSVLTTTLDLNSINETGVFVPVLPLFESSGSSKIPPAFMNSFLAEEARSIEEKRKAIAKIFPSNDSLATLLEAQMVVELKHANKVSEAYSQGVDYIEDMLQKQLIAAIGKVVTPVDFANYLVFHNRKIFVEGFRPQPFSYAIRRPDHSPEGTLSIAAKLDDGSISTPISTIVSHSVATHPMYFSINEATKVSFLGDRYLHGYVSHQFAGESGISLSLKALSRQFSSFIFIVGRIVSATQLDPKYAIIIQNKDELKIPLMLETIPTPKEFRDAIESLSPEQQRFCKAFRSMQLESTLFGVAIIQIKPQLEKVLRLPADSLTKEIQLTQDLLNMFIKYQIPTDLLAYDGPLDNSVDTKINRVKEYMNRMTAILEETKKAELAEAQQEQQMRAAQQLLPRPHMAMMDLFGEDSFFHGVMPAYAGNANIMSAPPHPPPTTRGPPQPNAPNVPEPVQKQDQQRNKDLEQPGSTGGQLIDYTQIPNEMERKFDKFDESNALRPTIINTGKTWDLSYQKTLLSEPASKTLNTETQEKERSKAFDLLDALTKSGVLAVDHAALHVVIASTHCFAKNIIQTVIQDNVNPIEKVENSSLIIASTIHQTEPANLIAPEHLARITTTSALLLTGVPSSNNNNDKNLLTL